MCWSMSGHVTSCLPSIVHTLWSISVLCSEDHLEGYPGRMHNCIIRVLDRLDQVDRLDLVDRLGLVDQLGLVDRSIDTS